MTKILNLPLRKIVADPGVQVRVALDEAVAQRYADLDQDGVKLHGPTGRDYPVVFYDGGTYWLGDGFLRRFGYELNGRATMDVEVRPGGRVEATLHNIAGNDGHGMQLTQADRIRAAWLILSDEDLQSRFLYEGELSERAVARFCGISPTTVGVLRQQLQDGEGVQDGHPSDDRTKQTKSPYTEPEAQKRLCAWATIWLERSPAEGESSEYAQARRLIERAVRILEREKEAAAA